MDKNQSVQQSLSEEDSEDDHNSHAALPSKRRCEDESGQVAKRRKTTSLGSMPRLSNASSTSIISTESSEEESGSECGKSNAAYGKKYGTVEEQPQVSFLNGQEYIEGNYTASYDSRKTRTGVRSISNASTASSVSASSSQSSDEESGSEQVNRADSGYLENSSSFGSQKQNSISNGENIADSKQMSVAEKMMSSMGYAEGKGLGKFSQGIVSPIEASNQRGRRGLGFNIKGLEPLRNLKWDSSYEVIVIEENIFWLPDTHDEHTPESETLYSWTEVGPKVRDISKQTDFVHPDVLKKILESKNVFDELEPRELMLSRSRSNPFETLGKMFFQNRAALKMANMEAVFDYMFTKPIDRAGKSLVEPDEVLYFADVCAAPGGFSEYVLWRRKMISNGFCDAKGFGFTLKENDFKLHDFFAAPCEFFEPHYGKDGTGNIYSSENITCFCNFVLKSTNNKGVHFMMADGGFSVEGQENIQEILSNRLYLCQFTVALGIVREGGHFVCKLFDVFTRFTVGLVYLMYKCFDLVCLHKPNSSRPANSERYIICKWRKKDVSEIYKYLYEMNTLFDEYDSEDLEISDLVSIDVLRNDATFFQYVVDSNNVFGRNQIIGLEKIRCFCQDRTLVEDRQASIRAECIKFWELPDKARSAPKVPQAMDKLKQLLTLDERKEISCGPIELSQQTLGQSVHSSRDFRFVFINSLRDKPLDRGFYLGLGGCNNVFRWTGKEEASWARLNFKVELPPDTLVYGEVVRELRGELRAQKKVTALHLIDALWLNGFDCRSLHVSERHAYLEKLCNSLNKPTRNYLAPLRCQPMYKFEEIESILRESRLRLMMIKSSSNARRIYCDAEKTADETARYSIPMGILMLKITQEPWMMAYSKSQKRKYFFNTNTRESVFECLKGMNAPFSHSYSKGFFWWWDYGIKILETDYEDKSKLSLQTVIHHVKNH